MSRQYESVINRITSGGENTSAKRKKCAANLSFLIDSEIDNNIYNLLLSIVLWISLIEYFISWHGSC